MKTQVDTYYFEMNIEWYIKKKKNNMEKNVSFLRNVLQATLWKICPLSSMKRLQNVKY